MTEGDRLSQLPEERRSAVLDELKAIWTRVRRSRAGFVVVGFVVLREVVGALGDLEFAIGKATELGPTFLSTAFYLVGTDLFQAIATGVGLYWLWDSNRQRSLGMLRRMAAIEAERRRLVGERSALEVRFGDQPPYTLPKLRWYRLGIVNRGPAKASEVEVRLVGITPNPLPEELLPSRLGWKGGGDFKEIHPGRERLLDVVTYVPTTHNGSPVLQLQFWIDEGPAAFAVGDDFTYVLDLEILSANAEPKDVKLRLWRAGDTVKMAVVP